MADTILVTALGRVDYGTTAEDRKSYYEGDTFECSPRVAKQLVEAGAVTVSESDATTLSEQPTTDESYTVQNETSIPADNTVTANPNLEVSQPISLPEQPTADQIAQDLASVESPQPPEQPTTVQLN